MKYYKLEKNFFENNSTVFKKDDFKEAIPLLYPHENGKAFFFTQYTYNKIKENYPELFTLITPHLTEDSLIPKIEGDLLMRFHISLEAGLQDPPSPEVVEEIKLMLFSQPQLKLEYLGRNLNVLSQNSSEKVKKEKGVIPFEQDEKVFAFDILQGKRFYHFKIHKKGIHSHFNLPQDIKERYQNLKNWFNDPESKIILALGSGGCRMFAIPTVLKLINEIGPRDRIDEVWGSSGGSIMANLYSKGISPMAIEQIGHDFYNERYPDFFSKKSRIHTLLNLAKNVGKNPKEFLNLTSGMADIYNTFKSAYLKSLERTPAGLKEIPYFSISTNLYNDHPVALTDPQNISTYLQDYLIPCDPIQSMCASAAIPFIFPSEFIAGIHGKWVDGMLIEEIPLVLPVIKFFLDKENHPKFPYQKLKIFYVDLGTRLEEMAIFRYFKEHEEIFGKISLLGNIVDRLFNSKINVPKEIIKRLPDVEMLGVKLKIGKMAIFDSGEIPYIIQKGRESIISEFDKLEMKLGEVKDLKKPNLKIVKAA